MTTPLAAPAPAPTPAPAPGAPAAAAKTARPRSVKLLLAVAGLDAVLAFVAAFATPASAVFRAAGGYLVLDATSRLFLLVVGLVFLGVATYLWTRVGQTPELSERVDRLVGYSLAFVVAANLALLSNHLVATWALVELTTLAAVPLIQHRGTRVRLRASWTYFLFSSIGLALTLLGFACLARGMEASGAPEVTFFLDGLARAARQPSELWRRLGLVLIFLGLGTKLGLAPMYAWLPETYHRAPPAVTALLAAIQFNVALALVFRVVQIYRASDQGVIGPELVALGLATMAVSAVGIISTRNYTRLIAFASLNHGGVIAIGLGIGRIAAYGVVLYAVSNAFIKAILFLTAGKIEAHYGTEDVREVSGLLEDMPYSGLFFMVGTFALLGFPPFGSFLGELIVMSGLLRGGHHGVFAAFCAILTATFIATGRAIFPMIWGEPRKPVRWASQPLATIAPKLFLLACLVAMGLYLPAPVNALFRQVAAGLGAE
ncbi:proton-conducting transporter transmembrane domain-containing protein [Anaeromyxobacter oryzisoli]|uniref:proton-conducting transporter transmembrane domain-containing protein n=1 Tax=Anaeromyxobacter oryzisoli TaxID=2925408 RepID=UPI001F574C45|nr:proton-conducting transporter membrane subunit [Anaeromyxobacter sp. SG63]